MNNKGFTLIEILVSVTIIIILSTVGLVSYQAAGKASRDAKRKADLEQVRAALEIYKSENGAYPVGGGLFGISNCISSQACWTGSFATALTGYINPMPQDPKLTDISGSCDAPLASYFYNYCTLDNGQTYTLSANLESGPTPAAKTGTCCNRYSNYRLSSP